jgi:predicted lipoprotein with Yx(FWY)xxD motif
MTIELLNLLRKLRMTLFSGVTIIVISLIITVLSGCSKNDNTTPASKSKIIITSNTAFGNILSDGQGNTLYFFSKDVAGKSTCETGTCAVNWPSYWADQVVAGSGLDISDFSAVSHADGSMQDAYKGWLLYYYLGDTKPGDVNGDGIGGVWFVAKPDYSVMLGMEQLTGLDGKDYTGNFQVGTGETIFLTDSAGNTLYAFSHDSKDTNTFTSQDFSNNSYWPVFYSDMKSVPSLLTSGDFGEISVSGRQQLTYKGWPLYYFGQDQARGDTKGVSVPQPGVWPVVNQDTPAAQ